MKIFKHTVISILLGASVSTTAQTLTIGLDMSLSNPLVTDKAFSQQVAGYVAQQIKPMRAKDQVVIMPFGARDNVANLHSKHIAIKRHKQAKTAKAVAHHIINFSAQKSNAQQATNILAWLEFNDFNCAGGGTIIAVTDGIESSETLNPKAFITGKAALPKPDEFHQLQGCNVVFYGLGVGRPAKEAKIIRRAWTQYFKQAGVKSFTPIMP